MKNSGRKNIRHRFIFGFLFAALITSAIVVYFTEKSMERDTIEIYMAISIPEEDAALVYGQGDTTIYKYDDSGRLIDSKDADIFPFYTEAEMQRYASFMDVYNGKAYLYAVTVKDGYFTDVLFYSVDLNSLELNCIADLSDYLDLAGEKLAAYEFEAAASGDEIGFCTAAPADDGTDILDYRYFRLTRENDGSYTLSEKAITGNFYMFGFAKSAGMVFIDKDGDIFAPDVSDTPIFSDDGSRIGKSNYRHAIYEEGVAFYNTESDSWYFLSFEDGGTLLEADEYFGEDHTYSELSEIDYSQRDYNGYVTAYRESTEGMEYYFQRADGSFFSIDRLYPKWSDLWLRAAVILIPLILIEAGAAVVQYRRYVRNEIKITIFAKILICMLIVLAVLYYALTRVFTAYLFSEEQRFEQIVLYQDAMLSAEMVDMERLIMLEEGSLELNSENTDGMLPENISSIRQEAVKDEELQNVALLSEYYTTYSDLYLYKEGGVYNLNGYYPVDAMLDRDLNEAVNMVYRACESGTAMFEETGGGLYINAVIPISFEGRVIGAVESSSDTSEANYYASTQAKYIVNRIAILLAGLFLLILVWLRTSLYPLRKLKLAVGELTDGNTEVRVSEKGLDEIAEIGRIFNRMAEGIGEYKLSQEQYRQQYVKFVPEDTIRQMGKTDILDISLGDNADFDTAELLISCENFNDVYGESSEDMFKFINSHLPVQISVTEEYGGVVNAMRRGGIEAYFRKDAASALKAASKIVNFLNHDNSKEDTGSLDEGRRPRFVCVLSFGKTSMGVVGSKGRFSVENVSAQSAFTMGLLKIAADFGAEVLFTKRLLDHVEAADKINKRTIAYIESDHGSEAIYESLDGISPAQRRLRMETLDVYEKGVKAYIEGETDLAHRCFVEVLRRNKDDKAALRYFYLCDKRMEKADYGA